VWDETVDLAAATEADDAVELESAAVRGELDTPPRFVGGGILNSPSVCGTQIFGTQFGTHTAGGPNTGRKPGPKLWDPIGCAGFDRETIHKLGPATWVPIWVAFWVPPFGSHPCGSFGVSISLFCWQPFGANKSELRVPPARFVSAEGLFRHVWVSVPKIHVQTWSLKLGTSLRCLQGTDPDPV
jgi:hypothetical protein